MFGSLKKLFGREEKEEKIIAAPVSGKAIPMGQVNDPTFSRETPGKRIAVIPSDGRVVVPTNGPVIMVFDIKRAINTQTDNGTELIIHIGLDTVQFKGQYFEAHVVAGDKVKRGDPLLDFEIDKIKEAGYDMTMPVIICNTPQFPKMERRNGMEVKAGETVIIKL